MRDALYYLKHEVETVIRYIAERMLIPMSTFVDRLLTVTYFSSTISSFRHVQLTVRSRARIKFEITKKHI